MVPKEIEITTVDWEYYSQVVDSYNAAMNIVNAIKQKDTYEFIDEDWDTHIIFTDKIIEICISDWSYEKPWSSSDRKIAIISVLLITWLIIWLYFIANNYL